MRDFKNKLINNKIGIYKVPYHKNKKEYDLLVAINMISLNKTIR